MLSFSTAPPHDPPYGTVTYSPFNQGNGSGLDGFVARFLPDGSLDLTFGPDGTGRAVINLGRDSNAEDLAIQNDGNIVVVGTTYDASKQGWDLALVRLIGAAPPTHSPEGTAISLHGVVGRDPN